MLLTYFDLSMLAATLVRLQLVTTAELDAPLPSILDKAFRGKLSAREFREISPKLRFF